MRLQRTKQELLRELQRRRRQAKNWYKNSFKEQITFIEDTAPLVGALCTRRAGKSYGVGLKLCKTAFESPGATLVYIALTRQSAKQIMWKDVLKTINREFGIGARFNDTELKMLFPNGAELLLVGADAKPEEMQKLLGQKFVLAVIDEGSMFRIDLEQLIYSTLKPAVADYGGQIVIIGTPSNNTKSLYYDITTGAEPGWSVHRWSAKDNIHMKDKWAEELAFLKTKNPNIEETPIFRQMYLGEWVVDLDALIYKYDDERNFAPALPEAPVWHHLLGIDLGYNDPTAFVVCAYRNDDPTLYIVDCFKKSGMILTDVAEHTRMLQAKYAPHFMIIDNASRQAVEELVQRYHLPFTAAEKNNKYDFIQLMNTDIYNGHVKVLPKCTDLINEWRSLVWDERMLELGKHVEHPALPNHLSDAALYAWRWAYHYTAKPKTFQPLADPMDEWWEKEAEKINRRKQGQDEEEWLNDY